MSSAGTSSSARSSAGFVAAVVAIALVVAGIVVFRGLTGDDEGPQPAAQGEPAPGDREDCATLVAAVSPEKGDVLDALAADYNEEDRQVAGDCTWVQVSRVSSGAGSTALARGWDEDRDGPRPHVWSPAASSWLELSRLASSDLDQPSVVPAEGRSIAQSPLVIAMPRPMAEALGWPAEPLGWNDLLALARDPSGWGSAGHPEWGRFKLGKTNPHLSTSGLNATAALFTAATGVSSDLTPDQVRDPAVAQFVGEVERTVVHYGDTTLTFLQNLLEADRQGQGLTYISAVTVEEKSVLDYNAGNPAAASDPGELDPPSTPLVAVYPEEGTLVSDSPWAVLEAPWVGERERAVAGDFLDYLLEDAQQDRFADAGFRRADGSPGDRAAPAEGLLAEQPTVVLGTPSSQTLAAVLDAWDVLRKPARVLLVMDVSGSMGQVVEGSGSTRLELAQQATLSALDEFAAADEVGLWVFSNEEAQGGSQPWRELVPLGTGVATLDSIRQQVAALVPDGGTALYATAKAAHARLAATAADDVINAVVLLTDGRNEHPDNDLDGLLDEVRTEGTSTGVRVFTIGYGADADQGVMGDIATASRARSYDASDPATLDRVMVDVLSNF